MKILLLVWGFVALLHAERLEVLLEKVQKQNLTLQKRHDSIEISKKRVDFSDSWENPSLTFGANDLLLDDITSRDLEPMQTHYLSLSQKIPTSGKSAIKKRIAMIDGELARLNYHDSSLKLVSKLMLYSYKVAIIEKKLALIQRYQNNANRLKKLHTKRFEVGKSTQSSIENAKILSQTLRIKKRKLLSMKQVLLYRIEKIVFEPISSVEVDLVMDKQTATNIENHPIMIVQALRVKYAKENLKLKRAMKTPDIKVGVGYFQRVDRGDYLSLNAGLSLPIMGREQQEVEIALLALHQVETMFASEKFSLQKEVEILHTLMVDAKQNYELLNSEILPKQRYIQKLLQNEVFTKNISTTKLLESLNKRIILELEAYDEMERYFSAYAKLYYLQGALS